MNREVHVRFCERLGVKFPLPTRLLFSDACQHTPRQLALDGFKGKSLGYIGVSCKGDKNKKSK